jgi:hypothetical protein
VVASELTGVGDRCAPARSRRRRARTSFSLSSLQAMPRNVDWEAQAGSLGSVSCRLRGRKRRVYLLPDSRRVNEPFESSMSLSARRAERFLVCFFFFGEFLGFFGFFCGSKGTEMLVMNLTVAMRLQPPAPFELFY